MSPRPDPSSQEDSLDHAFAQYLADHEAGRSPSSEQLSAQYPELAGILELHKRIDQLTAPMRDLLSSTGSYPSNQRFESPLPPGTIVGDYELLETIGRGGMGIVYKARHRKFNLVVALKMLSSNRQPTEQQRRWFLAEVENQARLDHPHIVSISGGGEYQGQLYFTMKLIEGGDLETALPTGQVSTRKAADVMVKLARAVHHAHQRNILHRDLKPSNVLVDSDGEPYVADFGLAMLFADQPDDASGMVGSPAFAPPEQMTGQATTLSDVYGLGTILYWLLTGRRPCDAETLEETLHKVHHEMPEPPHRHNAALTHRTERYLELICLKCLEEKPERRYASADSLAVDLERYLGAMPPLAVPVRRLDRVRLWCRRNPFGAGAALTVLATVLLVVVGMVNIIRSQDDSLSAALALVDLQRVSFEQSPQKRQLGDFLLGLGERPNVPQMFQQRDKDGLQDLCGDAHKVYFAPGKPPERRLVAGFFAFAGDHMVLANSAVEGQDPLVDVGNRKYALRAFDANDGPDVFVSEVYESKSDGLWKYAVVARVRDPEDPSRVVGALAASIAPDASRTVESYESLVGRVFSWIAVALVPLAIFAIASVWFALRRARTAITG